MWLRHQQRTALDSRGESGGAAQGEAFRGEFDQRRLSDERAEVGWIASRAMEG
jgi:hypothetical protein